MAEGTWRSVDAKCPFYIRDGRRSITCEGITEGEENKRRLQDDAMCTTVFRTYCGDKYEECEIYKLVCRVKYGIE
jgi:hypothetical protein